MFARLPRRVSLMRHFGRSTADSKGTKEKSSSSSVLVFFSHDVPDCEKKGARMWGCAFLSSVFPTS